MEKLTADFYQGKNVVDIAKSLIGKVIFSNIGGKLTAGRIVETEAYNGIADRASHAYGGRRTKRTEVMYMPGGHAYVYLCYGIHHLFNVVTNKENVPHAVLIRALEPLQGMAIMLARTNKKKPGFTLASGPGKLSKAMGFSTNCSGMSLLQDDIFIAADGFIVKKSEIIATRRIGVSYAGEDAKLPYRFVLKGNKFVSRKIRI